MKINSIAIGFFFLLISYFSAAQTPRLIIDSKGHTGLVNKIIFLDEGRRLISVSNDKTIRLWDVNNGNLLRTFYVNQSDGYHGRIYAAALSSDEKTLAIAGFMGQAGKDSAAIGSIYLLSLEKPAELIQLKGHTNVVTDLVVVDDKLISASADKTIKIWSMSKHSLLSTFTKHRFPITRIALTPQSKKIASADIYGNVLIWNLDNGEIITDKIGKFHEGAITSLTFSDDEAMLFTGGEDGKVIKWTTAGKFLETIDEAGAPVNAVIALKGKNQVLLLSKRGTVKSLTSGADLLTFSAHNNTVSAAAAAPFTTFADVPGTYVATAGGDEKEIFIWNTIDGNVVRKFAGQGHAVFATGSLDDGLTIAFGQSNPTDILEDAPLEKSFNFENFSLKDFEKDLKFRQYDRDYLGSKIFKESTFVLNYGTGNIQVDPQKDGEIRSYTFLNDHNTIAIGSTFGIPVFNRTGELTSRLVGHNGEIWSVCPLGTELLISSSADQTIKIWNYKTKELLLTYFPATDREWVVWSPSGYYHASAGGEKYIGWLVNKKQNQLSEFHEVSQFREKYHKPSLIAAIMREKSLEKAAKSLNMLIPKEEEIIKMLPPKVSWLLPSGYTADTKDARFLLKASIESNNPIKTVKLMVNGRPYLTRLEEFNTEKTEKGINVAYELDFSKVSFQNRGLEVVAASEVENQKQDILIQMFAENEVASILTDTRTISWIQENNRVTPSESKTTPSSTPATTTTKTTTPSTPDVELPNLYMVTIGVSSFKNPAYNLNFADDDAKAIETVFKGQEGRLFKKVYNFSLINEKATREKILTSFDRLKQVVTPKDFVVIFIATHGINRENQFYILPHDGEANKANITCVNWRDFSDVVGNLPSQVLLLVDACHSGQLGQNMGQVSSDNTEAVRQIASGEYGVVIMAASTGAEYSLEHADWGHGAFTLSLVEGLEQHKADIRPDGTIYIRELDFYVAERVKELTNNLQHPTTQKPSSISTMPVLQY